MQTKKLRQALFCFSGDLPLTVGPVFKDEYGCEFCSIGPENEREGQEHYEDMIFQAFLIEYSLDEVNALVLAINKFPELLNEIDKLKKQVEKLKKEAGTRVTDL